MLSLIRRHLGSTVFWLVIASGSALLALVLQRQVNEHEHRANLQIEAAKVATQIQADSSNGLVMGGAIASGLTDDSVKQLLRGKLAPNHPHILNNFTGIIGQYDAAEVLVLSAEGATLAYLNNQGTSPGLGRNLRIRPYWRRAMAGQPNVYPAIGSNTAGRGLYFAAPVHRATSRQSPVIGVYTIKLDASTLDKTLSGDEHPALLTSPTGLVFAANRPEWILHQGAPLSAAQRTALRRSSQFGNLFAQTAPPLPTLPFNINAATVTLNGKQYAVTRQALDWPDALGQWHIVILNDTSGWLPVWQSALLAGGLFFGILLLGLIPAMRRLAREESRKLRNESANRLRDLTDTLPLAVFQYQMNEQGDNRYLFVSRQAEEILGVSAQTISADPNARWQNVPAEESAVYQALCTDRRLLHEPVEFEHTVTFDGETRWIRSCSLPAQQPDGRIVWNGFWMDISEHRQQQQSLHEALGKAEDATRAKSMFLANMSHEIRTPMNAIIGMSYLALNNGLPPRARDYVQKIHHAGMTLLGIINDILDFSKIEAGQLGMEAIDFDLDEVLSNVMTVTAAKAREKALDYRFDVPPALPRALHGDPLRLGQVLINLLNNAIKFTAHGEVRLSAHTDQDGETWRFEIRDTGIGMSGEQSARLFQPFTQADGSTTRRFGGTGLGLSISKRLVELMEGEIGVNSTPDLGSTFWFTCRLPRASTHPARLATSPDAAPPPRPTFIDVRALVVEDNEINQQIVRELLEAAHIEVDMATNGFEALSRCRQHPADYYDLVLMDLQMPVMDGHEVTLSLRADPRLITLPIIAMTAHAMPGEGERCRQEGMNDLICKPIKPLRFYKMLSHLFSDRRVTAQADEPARNIPPAGDITLRPIRQWEGDLSQLTELMESCDREALDLFEQIAEEFALTFGPSVMDGIRHCLAEFDFDSARGILLDAARARGLIQTGQICNE